MKRKKTMQIGNQNFSRQDFEGEIDYPGRVFLDIQDLYAQKAQAEAQANQNQPLPQNLTAVNQSSTWK